MRRLRSGAADIRYARDGGAKADMAEAGRPERGNLSATVRDFYCPCKPTDTEDVQKGVINEVCGQAEFVRRVGQIRYVEDVLVGVIDQPDGKVIALLTCWVGGTT
jgi:hypothetical protein